MRAHVARGVPRDLRPLPMDTNLALGSSSPEKDCCRLVRDGPQLVRSQTKIFLLQAVGASSISSLQTVMAELGRVELGVRGKAHYGGAYDRMRVRTRVNAGAWQGLQWRLKAPSHRAEPALPT